LTFFSRLLAGLKQEKEKMGQHTLRLLSLASSSGEEAYTLNIIIQESGLFDGNWDVRITGVDMDRNALEKARSACYTKNSFKIPEGDNDIAKKYFTAEEAFFALREPYTNNTEFRYGNITSSSSFEGLDIMDVIFCRNVLISMTENAFGKIIRNCYRTLSDAGYLFVGSSESLIRRTDLFVPEYKDDIVVYRKNLNCGSLP